MKALYVLPALLLLCACTAKPAVYAEPESTIPAVAFSELSRTEETEAALNRLLHQAETLETETAGSGMKWCALAAELLELVPPDGGMIPVSLSIEAENRLYGAALLLTTPCGAGLLEDCGHPPLSRVWSAEEIQMLFEDCFHTE